MRRVFGNFYRYMRLNPMTHTGSYSRCRAITFECGEADTHVPPNGALGFRGTCGIIPSNGLYSTHAETPSRQGLVSGRKHFSENHFAVPGGIEVLEDRLGLVAASPVESPCALVLLSGRGLDVHPGAARF